MSQFLYGICTGFILVWLRLRLADYLERRKDPDHKEKLPFLRWARWEVISFIHPLNFILYDLVMMRRCKTCHSRFPSSINMMARWGDMCSECYFEKLLLETKRLEKE